MDGDELVCSINYLCCREVPGCEVDASVTVGKLTRAAKDVAVLKLVMLNMPEIPRRGAEHPAG